MENDKYDVIVVGAGPAGVTAAIYLKRANLNCCIIEKGTPGGQLNKSSIIENYPGFKSISGPDLAMTFYEQINSLNIPLLYGEVISIENKEDNKIIHTKDKDYECKAIILCLGRQPRKVDAINNKSLEGRGISYCSLCDGYLFKNEDVAIIGGGNSALEESLSLAKICKSVTIIHRRDILRGDKVLIDRVIKTENIKILYNSQVIKFNSDSSNKLESLDLQMNDKPHNIKVKACFIFIGYEPATEFLKELDILNEKGYIITDLNGKTNIPFIYAAGDIIEKEAYQIVTATGEGAKAAISCIKDIGS